MRAVVWHGRHDLAVEDVPAPVEQPGDLLFHVEVAGICGSDLHAFNGAPGPRVPPLILGHEAVGSTPGLPGTFVLYPLKGCGECNACASGAENLCRRRSLVGLNRPGVFAEAAAVPGDALIPIPAGLKSQEAVLAEPLATSLSAIRGASVPDVGEVVVIGCGAVGLLAVHACASQGRHVVAADPVERRRDVAISLGATKAVADVTTLDGLDADLVLDTAGVEQTWLGALDAVRAGGEIAVIGLGQAEGAVRMSEIVRRGIALRGQYGYTRDDFRAALALLAERPLDTDWITVLPLETGPEGFRRLVEQPDSAIKVLLAPARRR